MATRYQVRLKDQDGTVVSILPDEIIRRLEYTRRVNGSGAYTLRLWGESDVVDLFELDGQVEIWRGDIAATPRIDLYLDFEGFHRTELRSFNAGDQDIYQSTGAGYLDLLRRRAIEFVKGSAGAFKSGAGETVIKAYVDENAGPGAGSPRLRNGTFTGLTIQTDGGAGSTWEGERAFLNLLEVISNIADATSVDFELIGTGAATFEFRAQAKPLGTDRRASGVDPLTGLNAAGNAPVIFSLAFGNMSTPEYSLNRAREANVITVLGQGAEANREVVQRESAAIANSPWNDAESVHNANQEGVTAGLNVVGDALLDQLQARETFGFQVIQTEASRLGREYFLGDIVTARFKDIQRDKQIVGYTIGVQEGVESIEVEVADVT